MPVPTPTLDKTLLDAALNGSDLTPRLVAVETQQDTATLFARHRDGSVTSETVPFIPWLIQREERFLPDGEEVQLIGEGYSRLVRFPNWRAYQDARQILRDERRDFVQYGSPQKQFLLGTGRTLFKGMAFTEVRRMQVDIETTTLSFNEPGAKIFLIACSDNVGNEELLFGDERDMLWALSHLVSAWDPDIIEGHNLYAFDLPWIRARARALNIALPWGRDSSEVGIGSERNCALGANTRPFTPHYIWGRHVLDTLFQTQRFDVARGEISSYNLKECARTYHIAEPDRVYIPHDEIASLWRTDPERVKAYTLGDVRETRRLAEIVTPTEFYSTQMVPDVFQTVAVTGSGEKINSVFVRAYLQAGHAIARQQPSQPYGGGYTEMRLAGLLRGIVKADVESLYPSIMLNYNVSSSSDTLGLFLPLLKELTRRRLMAKRKAKDYESTKNEIASAYWDGLQGSYKLLINSFYGYLGAPFYFNDYTAAAKVTEIGQVIVKQIAEELETRGATVIEIDTDGVYFQPPAGILGLEPEEAFITEIGAKLPEGIRLAFDGRYEVMLSLKAKNYVLVSYEGKTTFKGSSLRSRADEKFGKKFLYEAVDFLLADNREGLSARYKELLDAIESRTLGIEQISRRERVTDKTFTSDAKKRNAEAMAGLTIGDYAIIYQREGDKALVSAENYNQDEDVEYYQTKLYKFATRLEAAIGEDFEKLCPKPLVGAKRRAAEDAKHQMSLFEM
ncbi:DNA polymerase domain-containing protein [Armatimonas sp.]|uniref:DNA polymerase domain-containing protein n=1 Tax=Armatimonas sp. TaxID=1872638 RepID=UPI00374D122B